MFSFRFMHRCNAQLSKLSSSIGVHTRPTATRVQFSTMHTKRGSSGNFQNRKYFRSGSNTYTYPLLFAIPAAAVGAALCERRDSPVLVETTTIPVTSTHSGDVVVTETPTQAVIQDRLGRISFGFLLGFSAGYAAKKIGKAVLVIAGTFFMVIQYLSYKGYVAVNWGAVTRRASPITDPAARSQFIHTIIAVLTHNLLVKTGFVSGMAVGFKLG